eukprot:scaffold136_cov418-Prasinococcus_capsulatus_cf.AAC.4
MRGGEMRRDTKRRGEERRGAAAHGMRRDAMRRGEERRGAAAPQHRKARGGLVWHDTAATTEAMMSPG